MFDPPTEFKTLNQFTKRDTDFFIAGFIIIEQNVYIHILLYRPEKKQFPKKIYSGERTIYIDRSNY